MLNTSITMLQITLKIAILDKKKWTPPKIMLEIIMRKLKVMVKITLLMQRNVEDSKINERNYVKEL